MSLSNELAEGSLEGRGGGVAKATFGTSGVSKVALAPLRRGGSVRHLGRFSTEGVARELATG
ncbi:hypothetical protein AB0N89_07425, partial [Amycolatopsis sp. NPDC089917]|uniref:hypothetical protein n=1 Tax=Amycolatopsis sp. NPDC089917 TaxID=3155187 RepID=UPI0034323A54